MIDRVGQTWEVYGSRMLVVKSSNAQIAVGDEKFWIHRVFILEKGIEDVIGERVDRPWTKTKRTHRRIV